MNGYELSEKTRPEDSIGRVNGWYGVSFKILACVERDTLGFAVMMFV